MADIYIRARCDKALKEAVAKFVADKKKTDRYWDESRVVVTAVEEFLKANSSAASARRAVAGALRDPLKRK